MRSRSLRDGALRASALAAILISAGCDRPTATSTSTSTSTAISTAISTSTSSPSPSPTPAPPPRAPNPVQTEMLLLHAAMQESLTALAYDRLEAIPAAFERVASARPAVEKAIEAGTYKPPKNPDRVRDMAKEDDAFHPELEKLVDVAKAKDNARTSRQYGTVLLGCTECHRKYRF